MRSSSSIGSAVKSLMRLSSARSASRNALHRSTSVPSIAAGSGAPQCAVMGLPGQIGADLAGSLIADGEHEIHFRRAGLGELVPSLAAHTGRSQVQSFQQLDRERMHAAAREAAGAVTLEPSLAPMLDQRLGENASRRVAGAEKQDVVGARRRHGCGLRASTMAETT